jgi:hypothetical protein
MCGYGDLSFRLVYRKARTNKRTLIVLARSTDNQSKIDISYVTDILAANEGGPPLDLSVLAVFRRLFPKINFPAVELRRFKDALLERLEDVPKAVDKIVDRWGRPDDWGRGQVAALVLLARHPDWALADIWPDETDPATAVAHGVRVLLSVPSESSDLPIIRDMLQDAVRQDVREHCHWFGLPPDWVAGYLLIRALADELKLQNPAVQLAGLQVFPLEMSLDKLEALSSPVISAMKANAKAWRLVERRAEDFITPKRSEKLAILIPADTTGKVIGAMASPVMLFLYLQQRLLSFFAKPVQYGLNWTSELASHPVLKADFGEMVGRRRQCLAAARLAQGISLIESRLATKIPTFPHADGLLDWYVSSELGFTDKGARPVNVLIYPISDECHEYKGDLAAFNNKIRQDILGDHSSGIRGILDDLLLRLRPGDLVFATSDHGFIELYPDAAVIVSQADVVAHKATFADAVFYRYAKRFKPSAMSASLAVEAGSEPHYLCVGRQWLKREGVGTTVRYSHGGLSLSEVVIPAVRLERVTTKVAAIELTGLPAVISVDEDQDVELAFGVRNKGNVESSYELMVRTNLGDELLASSDNLGPAAIRIGRRMT